MISFDPLHSTQAQTDLRDDKKTLLHMSLRSLKAQQHNCAQAPGEDQLLLNDGHLCHLFCEGQTVKQVEEEAADEIM